jgi:hypothetical protein
MLLILAALIFSVQLFYAYTGLYTKARAIQSEERGSDGRG